MHRPLRNAHVIVCIAAAMAATSPPAQAQTISGSAGAVPAATPRPTPDDPYAHAVLFYIEGDYETCLERIADFESRKNPDFRSALLKGAALARLARFDEARQAFLLAERIDPVDPAVPLSFAELELIQGRTDAARGHLKRSLRAAKPEHREQARFLLVLSHLRDRDRGLAGEAAKSLPWPSATPARAYALAALAFHDGDARTATDQMQEAERIFGAVRTLSFADTLVSMGWLKPRYAVTP